MKPAIRNMKDRPDASSSCLRGAEGEKEVKGSGVFILIATPFGGTLWKPLTDRYVTARMSVVVLRVTLPESPP